MKNGRKKGMAFAILITAIGVAWLLNVMGFMPRVDWVWTGSLGVAGVLVLAFGGLNQLTAIAGPLLIISSLLSILRQTGRLEVELEVPILVICFGCLMMLTILFRLPMPRYLQVSDTEEEKGSASSTEKRV